MRGHARGGQNTSMEGLDYDVVVVGAGLAGLRTTQLLVQQGLSVLCLEANNVRCCSAQIVLGQMM